MPLLYSSQYECRPGENIGNPAWHNVRWRSVDIRLGALEEQRASFDDVIASSKESAAARVNEALLPEVQRIQQIASLGVMFRTSSPVEMMVEVGGKTLLIPESDRKRYAVPGYVLIYCTHDTSKAMVGRVVSYDAATGELQVDVTKSTGSGVASDWTVCVAAPYDIADSMAHIDAAVASTTEDSASALASAISATAASASAATGAATATSAATTATAAAASAQTHSDTAISALQSWNGRYLGPAASDPATGYNGAALTEGLLYWNTTYQEMRAYSGTAWVAAYLPSNESVSSCFGRTGAVGAASGDYRGDQIARDSTQQSALDGATVEAALITLKGQVASEATARSTADGLLATKATTITGAGLASGGGDLSANRSIAVMKATQEQAQAGTDDATAMTPLRTADAIAALVPTGTTDTAGKARLATMAEGLNGTHATAVTPVAVAKAMIDAAVAALVGSAPDQLDALNELATALGNDPNFSSTVASALANRALKTGDTFTGLTRHCNGQTGRSNAASMRWSTSDDAYWAGFYPRLAAGGMSPAVQDDDHALIFDGGNIVLAPQSASSNYGLRLGVSGITFGGATLWHAGNDGDGSGLDADLLDGRHSSEFYAKNRDRVSVADGGTGAATPGGARLALGLGGMATQNPSAVAITGGTITGIDMPGVLLGILEERQPVGINGGTFYSGVWQKRYLNTEVFDKNGILTLSNGEFTIWSPGDYVIEWTAPAYAVRRHQSVLSDITNSANVGVGTSMTALDNAYVSNESCGVARVSIAGQTTFRLIHCCEKTMATYGLGVASGFYTEVYCRVKVSKG